MSIEIKEKPDDKKLRFSLATFLALSGIVLAMWSVIWLIQSSIFNERIDLLQEKLRMVGEKYYIESQAGEIEKKKTSTLLPERYFTFYSIKNNDTLMLNENVHIDGFLKTPNFNPNEDFLWIFFKLNDNYYIKPNSQASFNSDYWSTTMRWDNKYDSVVAFKVKRNGNKIFQEWTNFRFGGIKIDEFPNEAAMLGEVSVNSGT